MKLNWKKSGVVAALVGAFLLAMAIVGFSQEGRPQGPPHGGRRGGFHGGPRGPHDGLGHLLHGLNLTDEQKAQLKQIHEQTAESTKALREQLRALHESDMAALKDGAFDEAAVRAAAESRAKIQVELEVAHARAMSQAFAVLTAEQKAQLAAKRQQFEQRRKERREGERPVAPDEQ